jgi:hypothetical protein
MAVVSVTEIWNGRTNSVSDVQRRTYRRVFRVRCDTMTDGPVKVRLTSGMPAYRDPYVHVLSGEWDLGALAKSIDATQEDDDPHYWIVTVDYDSVWDGTKIDPALQPAVPSGQGEQQGSGHERVTGKPLEISYDGEEYQKVVEKAMSSPSTGEFDEDIKTSAGSRFDPAPEIEASRLVLTIVRNELAFDVSQALEYGDTINNAVWYGFPARTVKMSMPKADRQFEEGIFYWKVTYRFKVRKETWVKDLLDQDVYFLDAGVRKQIIDPRTHTPVTRPQLLNGAGAVLAVGADGEYLSKFVYPEKDFSALGLGS